MFDWLIEIMDLQAGPYPVVWLIAVSIFTSLIVTLVKNVLLDVDPGLEDARWWRAGLRVFATVFGILLLSMFGGHIRDIVVFGALAGMASEYVYRIFVRKLEGGD